MNRWGRFTLLGILAGSRVLDSGALDLPNAPVVIQVSILGMALILILTFIYAGGEK